MNGKKWTNNFYTAPGVVHCHVRKHDSRIHNGLGGAGASSLSSFVKGFCGFVIGCFAKQGNFD